MCGIASSTSSSSSAAAESRGCEAGTRLKSAFCCPPSRDSSFANPALLKIPCGRLKHILGWGRMRFKNRWPTTTIIQKLARQHSASARKRKTEISDDPKQFFLLVAKRRGAAAVVDERWLTKDVEEHSVSWTRAKLISSRPLLYVRLSPRVRRESYSSRPP